MMKVEVLYVPDCPFRRAAVKLVKDVLASQGVTADVREILVRDETMAAALGFFGSPSIHINGRDIAGEPPDAKRFALSCRLYPESQVIGLPPAELVRRAVVSAREGARPQMKHGPSIAASVGAILTSVAAIGCCLPLGFAAALGAGAASAVFATLRPWLMGVSVLLLGLGFWQRHRAKQCAVRDRLVGSMLLWAAVIVVVAMSLFPQQVAGFVADLSARGSK